ncbi:AAA domain-containing protein [Hysterangium stoloniferum]|nr:AAA domain-containing protein [Hysterangium stoloniferum]
MAAQKRPTILITGTPGKTTTAELLVAQSLAVPLRHINVGELVKDRQLHEGFDKEWESFIVDDDKVLDELEPMVEGGGVVLDWHTCSIFPERWIDLVVVLRCNHTTLWNRLEERNYPLKKIQENNESEIMQIVLEEARESYPQEIVVELQSESTEDLETNVARIIAWINEWQKNNATSES